MSKSKAGDENQLNAFGLEWFSRNVPGCLHAGSVFILLLLSRGLIQLHILSGGLKVKKISE